MATSCGKAFDVPELLEMVLLHLPLLDLLFAKQVSSSWKGAVERSIEIQQTLFLKPFSTIVLEINHLSERAKDARNTEEAWTWQAEKGAQLVSAPLLNPFLNGYTSDEYGGRAALLHNELVCSIDPAFPQQDDREPK